MKGFDIYERVDRSMADNFYKDRISFTYIGSLPKGFRFQNARYIEPKYGNVLADELRDHHVYLTASRNEPGANHQNEGANCGLPLLYLKSGCMPEYCNGFGISFNKDNFEEKLEDMIKTYDYWVDRMKNYPHTAEQACKQYYDLFVELLDRRDEIIRRRKWWRWPIWMFKFAKLRWVKSVFSRIVNRI